MTGSNVIQYVGWVNTHLIMSKTMTMTMKSKVLFDSGLSRFICCNKDYNDQIIDTIPIDSQTKRETMYIGKSCVILDLGKGYFDSNAITDIIGLSDMTKQYTVIYESSIEPAFLIHTN